MVEAEGGSLHIPSLQPLLCEYRTRYSEPDKSRQNLEAADQRPGDDRRTVVQEWALGP